MTRHPFTDGWKIAVSLLAGPVAVAGLAFGLVAGFAYCAGQRGAKQDAKVAALVDTVRIADSSAKARTDTVIIYRAASAKAKASSDSAKVLSDSLDRLVGIVSDSSVSVHQPDSAKSDTTVIPPEVVADLRALRRTVAKQDTTIHWLTVENRSLWMRDTTRQWQIDSRDKLIRELSKPRCGKKCGFLLGVGAAVLIRQVK